MHAINYLKSKKNYFTPVLITGICLYALFLRLMSLHKHTLWTDEFHQLDQMTGSFLDMIKSLPIKEYCSYLSGDFYLTYPFFKIFYYNKWGLAIPHIVATILGFYILYLLCQRYFKSIWGYLVTFGIVCFNATLIYHATEIRVYAVLPTLALASLYISLLLVEQNSRLPPKKKMAIGCFFVMLIWFHVYGIGIFAVSILYSTLAARCNNNFKTIVKYVLKFCLVIFCITMPLWLLSVFGKHYQYSGQQLNMFQFIPNPLLDSTGFLKGIIGNLVGYKKFYILAIALVFPFIFSYEKRLQQIGFLLVLVCLPLILIFLSDLKSGYWFVQRQFVWVIPYFALFLGWSWDSFIGHIGGMEFWTRYRKSKEC